jgi:hypothetical protein
MKKEDFKVGMIVRFARERFGANGMPRGVIIKVNPKRAKVKSLDPAGKWPAGGIWTCHYGSLEPLVGGDEISNEMTMRSFEKPDDPAIRAWSAAQKSKKELPDNLPREDEHIVRAIQEIYSLLEDAEGAKRIELSQKIHLLFRAFGREVSREESESLLERIP